MARTETLTCERGNHTWQRTSARGRKPRVCPDTACDGTATVPAESDASGAQSSEVRSVPDSSVSERIDNLTARMATLVRLDAERLRMHRGETL